MASVCPEAADRYARGDMLGAAHSLVNAAGTLVKTHGRFHPRTFSALTQAACLLQRTADNVSARNMVSAPLVFMPKELGAGHPVTVAAAEVLQASLKALEASRKAPGARRGRSGAKLANGGVGPYDETASLALYQLAEAKLMEGDFEGARGLLERVVAKGGESLPTGHDTVSLAETALGVALQNLGRHKEALPHLRRALALFSRFAGAEHFNTFGAMKNLGSNLNEMEDYAGARRLLEPAVKGLEKTLGPEVHLTLSAKLSLSISMFFTGEPEAAVALLEGVHEARKRTLGRNHPSTASALELLGKFKRTLAEEEPDSNVAGPSTGPGVVVLYLSSKSFRWGMGGPEASKSPGRGKSVSPKPSGPDKAGSKPVTRGKSASPKPVPQGKAAASKSATQGKAPASKPVTRGEAPPASKPVTRGKAPASKPVTRGKVPASKPVGSPKSPGP
jgi:tetratricopeptide (TPR) repeat protein